MDRYHVNVFEKPEIPLHKKSSHTKVQKTNKVAQILVCLLFLNIVVLIYVSVESSLWNAILVDKIFSTSSKSSLKCKITKQLKVEQRSGYVVFHNVFTPPDLTFDCNKAVTMTLTSDLSTLHNIVTLIERWRGPTGLALYAPGNAFQMAVHYIHNLRECNQMIKNYVSFHIFYENANFPTMDKPILQYIKDISIKNSICNRSEIKLNLNNTFERPYHINLARNIAIQSVETNYIFSTDINLIPSENLVENFLNISSKENSYSDRNKIAFIVPVFQMENATYIPGSKKELLEFYKNKSLTIRNNQQIDNWFANRNVLENVKQLRNWQPFFVAAQTTAPFFDERIIAEYSGINGRLIQALTMCLLDFDFVILDETFLIEINVQNNEKYQKVARKNKVFDVIESEIEEELYDLYGGQNISCQMTYLIED